MRVAAHRLGASLWASFWRRLAFRISTGARALSPPEEIVVCFKACFTFRKSTGARALPFPEEIAVSYLHGSMLLR